MIHRPIHAHSLHIHTHIYTCTNAPDVIYVPDDEEDYEAEDDGDE